LTSRKPRKFLERYRPCFVLFLIDEMNAHKSFIGKIASCEYFVQIEESLLVKRGR